MSQLANCPLTEATLDRIATVESRLAIAPPNPLIRQMMLLQIGLLVAVIVGLVCVAIGIGLTVGFRTVSDQAGQAWRQVETQFKQEQARKEYEAGEAKREAERKQEEQRVQAELDKLNRLRADEEAAARQQAEAERLKAEQQRLDAQRAEAARLQKQEQDDRLNHIYRAAPDAPPEPRRSDCVGLRNRITPVNPATGLPKGMNQKDYRFYLDYCAPGVPMDGE
ncbi:MAG: hypothetical protein NTW61_04835 [Candidatus Melainabacteria bacterium]|jgi:hypothetical protein|nr:hypothetical protein [Candidatus Melainabacteria bacterium]